MRGAVRIVVVVVGRVTARALAIRPDGRHTVQGRQTYATAGLGLVAERTNQRHEKIEAVGQCQDQAKSTAVALFAAKSSRQRSHE